MYISPVFFRDPLVLAAAKKGEISKIEEYIQKGGWVDMPFTKGGNSLLSVAARHGQKKVVEFLFEKGAHQYNNKKNEAVLSRAVGEAKTYLESKHKVSSLNVLICKKIKKLESVDEAIRFIMALPKEHQSAIEFYSAERTFTDPEQALQILDYVEEGMKDIVAGVIVKTACSCADVKLAYRCIAKLEGNSLFKKELEKDVERASDRLKKIEVNLRIEGFTKSLAEGFKLLNTPKKLLETEIDYLLTNMSKTETFNGALEFANSILDLSLRGFARCGLSYIDRESMERLCNEEGWEEFDQIDGEVWAAEAFFRQFIKEEVTEESFKKALVSLESQKDTPLYHEFRMRLCDQIFEEGHYELAYRVAKEEYDKKAFTERSKEVISDILSICNKEKLEMWEGRFKALIS